mgnify:CR=1 FL=1
MALSLCLPLSLCLSLSPSERRREERALCCVALSLSPALSLSLSLSHARGRLTLISIQRVLRLQRHRVRNLLLLSDPARELRLRFDHLGAKLLVDTAHGLGLRERRWEERLVHTRDGSRFRVPLKLAAQPLSHQHPLSNSQDSEPPHHP